MEKYKNRCVMEAPMPIDIQRQLLHESLFDGDEYWLFVDTDYDVIHDNAFNFYVVWDKRSCNDHTMKLVRISDNYSFRCTVDKINFVTSGLGLGNKPFEIYTSSLFDGVFTGETVCVVYEMKPGVPGYEKWLHIQNLKRL